MLNVLLVPACGKPITGYAWPPRRQCYVNVWIVAEASILSYPSGIKHWQDTTAAHYPTPLYVKKHALGSKITQLFGIDLLARALEIGGQRHQVSMHDTTRLTYSECSRILALTRHDLCK
jgi:hypothetical protein